MNGPCHFENWFTWLADTVTAEARLQSSADVRRFRRAQRRLAPIMKRLRQVDYPVLSQFYEFNDASTLLSHVRLRGDTAVQDNKRSSFRQTERLGIMVLLAYYQGLSYPVAHVHGELTRRGCTWSFHRINVRVNAFLKKNHREKRVALFFHFEQFKIAENKRKHAEANSRIRREDPEASDAELFPKIKPFLLEYRESNGRVTLLSQAEEKMLEDLLSRSLKIKSRGSRLPRSIRARRRRQARRTRGPE